MYNEMLTSKVYDFNIDIIEKKNEYIKKLESKIKQDDLSDINQPDISELPKKNLFIGDSVYVRTYENDDEDDRNPFNDLQESIKAGIIKKVSSEDTLPITPTPTESSQSEYDGDFFDFVDTYIVETEKNKITAWHLFFILFFIYILAHIFSVNLKFDVNI